MRCIERYFLQHFRELEEVATLHDLPNDGFTLDSNMKLIDRRLLQYAKTITYLILSGLHHLRGPNLVYNKT